MDIGILLRFLRGIRAFIYPARANCMGCSSPLGADVDWLCETCHRNLVPLHEMPRERCPMCGRIVRRSKRCASCRDWPADGLSMARFPFTYDSPIGGMIQKMKYSGVRLVIPWMARQMLIVLENGPLYPPDALVAVPMHKKRRRVRGFNHADLLAEELSRLTGCKKLDALARTRNTRQQARLSAKRRRANMLGAFERITDVEGLRILLIDDVLTTGATANQCARVLRAGGAVDVQLLTLAGAGDLQ